VLVGLAGGYWLDGRLGTRPVCLVLGGVFGMGAAMYHFFKTAAGLNKRPPGPKP
jgi:F0F1-type ATP synthase assembly protein I